MRDRRHAGILALAGAIILGLGCWLPYSHQPGVGDVAIFQNGGGYSGQLYFAVEPAAVAIAAAAIGLMLLRGPLPAVWAGVMIGTGAQTALMWVGYLGSTMAANYGTGPSPHVKAGGWVGLAGSLVIAAAGAVALRAVPSGSGELPPAGWYADPVGQDRLRYWSGSFWTEHTAS
jgi:Protein of unknown function (DUF2510)